MNRNIIFGILLLLSMNAMAVTSASQAINALNSTQDDITVSDKPVKSSPVTIQPDRQNTNITEDKKQLAKKHRKYYAPKQSTKNFIDSMIFDFSYSGDISGILLELKKYDNSLKILPSSGAVIRLPVNIDLQGVNLQDIINAVYEQTNHQAKLLYHNGTIMISYANSVDVGKDAVEESLKWQKGNAPKPILKRDGIIRFPFGEYQPVITCEPTQLCDMELQPGEEINGIAIGDSVNWNEGDNGIPIIYSGIAGTLTPHLILKPNRGGLDTSLVITTSRRTYMIKLKSSYNGYLARVGFYYPDEMIQKFELNKQDLRNQLSVQNNNKAEGVVVDLSKINNKYSISGEDYPWKPTSVYDDGTHVYIQMPIGVDPRSLPGLCVLVDGDDSETKCEFVNFKYDNHIYIVDKLFNKARLMNGYDDYQQVVTITRNPEKGFWSRLFGG